MKVFSAIVVLKSQDAYEFVDMSPEEEKRQQQELKEKFQPLLAWLKDQIGDVVRSGMFVRISHSELADLPPVVVSNRLVTSPCAIVADEYGYTANIEKLISAFGLTLFCVIVIERFAGASTKGQKQNDFMSDFAKKQKILEINPKSPLIEGLLRRIEQLPTDEDERDLESEEELREVASILIDGALVRSGFEVPDSNE
jgi:heat shock protein beta